MSAFEKKWQWRPCNECCTVLLGVSIKDASLYEKKGSAASSSLSLNSVRPLSFPCSASAFSPTLPLGPHLSFSVMILCSVLLMGTERCEKRLVRVPGMYCSADVAAGILTSPRKPFKHSVGGKLHKQCVSRLMSWDQDHHYSCHQTLIHSKSQQPFQIDLLLLS